MVAEYLWTSAKKLRGREFCSILNDIIRQDDPVEMVHTAMIIRAINTYVETID